MEDEKEVLGQLKANYTDALADIKLKIKNLQSNPLTQSKIYQIEYQQSLEKQISGILDILNGNNFATISEYLEKSYSRGFIGNMYDLQGQGVPLTIPIDENQVVKCVSRTADGYKLSDKLGGNTEKLKKQVKAHIQRGIAAEKPYTEIARSISDEGEADINRSMRIVRTEGGRIQNAARLDAMNGAAKRGADVVKMWDSTLDGKTRSTHRELDGQIKELDEPFEVAGKKAPAPCNFGIAAEDCNCRCCVLQRARWAVDNPEFQKYKMNNENGKIIECKDYKEFEEKYLKAVEKSDESGIIKSELGKFKKRLQNDRNIPPEYYSAVKEKFSHGSETAKQAFNKFVPDDSVDDTNFAGTPCFDPNTGKIKMNYTSDLCNSRGACVTWFHEHGHLIDNAAGMISDNTEFRTLLQNDYLAYMKSYGKSHGLKTFDKVQRAISSDLDSMRKHSSVSDIMQGISLGNIQGVAGHSPGYWNNPQRLSSEAFAHMFEAQFDSVRYTELKKYFPNALMKFEELLRGVV